MVYFCKMTFHKTFNVSIYNKGNRLLTSKAMAPTENALKYFDTNAYVPISHPPTSKGQDRIWLGI